MQESKALHRLCG